MKMAIHCSFLVLLAAIPVFMACGAPPKPFFYESDRELKKGPGLFSGQDGAIELYRGKPETGDARGEAAKPGDPERHTEETKDGVGSS
ncbi:MAG: hypothetical protein ACOZF0_01325 [Thermodesulfobacteriota bacterium]